jgi:hypothetical protein
VLIPHTITESADFVMKGAIRSRRSPRLIS